MAIVMGAVAVASCQHRGEACGIRSERADAVLRSITRTRSADRWRFRDRAADDGVMGLDSVCQTTNATDKVDGLSDAPSNESIFHITTEPTGNRLLVRQIPRGQQ